MKYTHEPTPRRRMMGALLASLAAATVCVAAQASIAELVTFGDSASDSGNTFALVGGTAVPPDYSVDPFLVPDRPYARGGHHFTNGDTWIEQLGRSIGLPFNTLPAFRGANAGAMNFSIGAARARDDDGQIDGDLPEQVAAYFQETGGTARADALYVIEVGGNDERDALQVALVGGDPAPIIQAAAQSIGANIGALYAAGARNFLVWTAPNVGFTPAVAAAGPAAVGAATLISQQFNTALAALLLSAPPDMHVVPFDVNQLLGAIVTNPAAFGFTNVTDACITPNVPSFACARPDNYLWWDGIHPTEAANAVIAARVAQLLGL